MTRRRILIGYQLITGASDTATGALLIFAPALTLRLMHLQAGGDALPFLSYVGVFVLSVGIACLYGGWLATRPASAPKLEVVWLLTAITRGLVAVFVTARLLSGSFETGWIVVALSDGPLALIQAIGLSRGWLNDALA